jgi:hypothetical protein
LILICGILVSILFYICDILVSKICFQIHLCRYVTELLTNSNNPIPPELARHEAAKAGLYQSNAVDP